LPLGEREEVNPTYGEQEKANWRGGKKMNKFKRVLKFVYRFLKTLSETYFGISKQEDEFYFVGVMGISPYLILSVAFPIALACCGFLTHGFLQLGAFTIISVLNVFRFQKKFRCGLTGW
jgi:hypothetical protein